MLLVNQILHTRYRIMRQLGHGGMGAVYEAHDSVFDTTCAIKEIIIDLSKSSNPKQHELVMLAFEREAKLLAKIKHEVVPHVRDYFTEDARQYLVMELVEGKDLGDLMEDRKSPFPLDDVLRWTEQLLDGLDYLHTQNPPIFHRDLKPQNLKLTPRGKIKLLDFGIAKGGQETPNQQTINNQTFVAATLNYSPVEQIFRVLDPVFREVLTQRYEARVNAVMQQNADARSDLYALGATVYHLLTDVLPIDALKRTVEVWGGKPDPIAHPTSLNNRIPPEIAAVLLKSMELDQGRRYSSALEMQQAMQQALAAIKARESAQGGQTLQMDRPTSSGELQATQLGGITGDTNAATQAIPPELLPPAYRPNHSEETIQGAGMTPSFGAHTGDTPPATPFSTGGQPTEMAGFGASSTGGTVPPPNFPPNFQPSGNVSSGAPMTPNYLAPQPPKKSSKIWWILPILALLFFVVAAAAGGLFLIYQSGSGGGGTANTTPSPSVSPTKSPSASPSPSGSATVSPSATPSVSPSASPENNATPKPTTEPTKQVVTPPVPPKTPGKTTPKVTPKKNSDCIFSGDC